MPRYLVAVMDTLSNGIPGTAEVVLEERVPIYSLHDQSQIRGSFFLGSGNLRGELCYALYLCGVEGAEREAPCASGG
jgi:hypothetical protein